MRTRYGLFMFRKNKFNGERSKEDGGDLNQEFKVILSHGKIIDEQIMAVKKGSYAQPILRIPQIEGNGRLPIEEVFNSAPEHAKK